MMKSTEDHYLILGQNVCPLKRATICSEKSMKGYVRLMKPKTQSFEKPYYKDIIDPIC